MVYASVIIFDFNRPNFIKDAITSIKSSSPGLDFEIIVIKSYIDLDIEKFLDEHSIVYIDLMEEMQQSDYIKAAVSAASGEIIIFMDDDDIFYPEKIGYVIDIFKTNKNLGYYHNNFDTIDESKNIIPNKNYKTPEFRTVYISADNKFYFFKNRKNLQTILKIRPDFNSSSIAIRRNLISEYHEDYNFNVRPDSFIFVLALISSMDIMLDYKVLTHYRIHNENVSTSYDTTINKLRAIFMEGFSKGIPMFENIEKMVRDTTYENYIKLRIVNLKLAYNFWALDKTFKLQKHDIFTILKIDIIHETLYIILSSMPAFIKLNVMKIFYHSN